MSFDVRLLTGLGVLGAVIETGSFARAGESMGLTQSAVSRAVARLEQRVGIRIFHRTARSISLTEEGKRFYENVAPHLSAIEDAAIEAGGASIKVHGRLRVNVDGACGQFLITPKTQAFLSIHPGLTLEIMVRDRIGDLIAEGFDAAIRFGLPEPSSLICRKLFETPVLTCASPEYLATNGIPSHPKDIEKGHQCILMRDPRTGRPFRWDFIRGKKKVRVAASGQLMVNSTGALLGACLGGQGIAQVLGVYSTEYIATGRLIRLFPEWGDETFPLYAYHHSPQFMSARVREFLNYVVKLMN